MKGSLHTDELMAFLVVSRHAGIRTARRISHCFIMDVPGHPDALKSSPGCGGQHRADAGRQG